MHNTYYNTQYTYILSTQYTYIHNTHTYLLANGAMYIYKKYTMGNNSKRSPIYKDVNYCNKNNNTLIATCGTHVSSLSLATIHYTLCIYIKGCISYAIK